jgi:hypothetical protein
MEALSSICSFRIFSFLGNPRFDLNQTGSSFAINLRVARSPKREDADVRPKSVTHRQQQGQPQCS